MATFITLHNGKDAFRYNADHIVQYWAGDHGGSRVMLSTMVNEPDVTDRVDEPSEQIDALLGVTESGEAIAAALEAEAARMDDDATAIHNGTMRGDMKLRAKAFRDAAKIARAARGEG
ncbi:hypothetical protein TSH7_25075 [Azospirillum sp. TSH7]|uniref:hypothetical protein n=1 Tax=unclassified Azospirillum TaxID=2630922 RepID=UPI000D60E44B|nr:MULTISPECIES: hypothetical protein [unclassified Azospirillum]PWC57821.1 hypothetical protein TSH7_25075 [Azospirillum sp. TSH7]PWC70240.1 hypothetical protein TSH20_07115 [Azospirillum sp. TSH20]